MNFTITSPEFVPARIVNVFVAVDRFAAVEPLAGAGAHVQPQRAALLRGQHRFGFRLVRRDREAVQRLFDLQFLPRDEEAVHVGAQVADDPAVDVDQPIDDAVVGERVGDLREVHLAVAVGVLQVEVDLSSDPAAGAELDDAGVQHRVRPDGRVQLHLGNVPAGTVGVLGVADVQPVEDQERVVEPAGGELPQPARVEPELQVRRDPQVAGHLHPQRPEGSGRPRARDLLLALLGPLAVTAASFGLAAAVGVVRFPGVGRGLSDGLLDVAVVTAIFTVVLLGEEIGWRGFLLLRLRELTSGKRAAVLTGACHAVFHVPLLTLTTSYQSEGSRWIVVPMVLVTLTLAGVWYGWLRFRSGSIWSVSLSHSAFNSFMEAAAGVAIAGSAVTMAYVTTETGVATLLVTACLATYLLLRRGADFEKKPLPVR